LEKIRRVIHSRLAPTYSLEWEAISDLLPKHWPVLVALRTFRMLVAGLNAAPNLKSYLG
jgi:hypothetical protein